jgi:hypothetical protein
MTTQVPPGPENAVEPQDYPQFTMGYAQYPPLPKPEPVSAPPATYPAEGYPAGAYPAVSYPQEGAPGYPVPVPYPQPGFAPPAATHPETGAYPPAATHAEASAYAPAATHPEAGAYPSSATHAEAGAYSEAVAYPQTGGYPQLGGHPQPGAYPQPAYPTAPPWAAAGPQPPAPALEQPLPPQYGGLLVPYPDKMQHASRAQPPAVWPVAVFTLLFSILGLASAKRRADQARRTRNSSAPYWIAFLVSAAAGSFIWFVLGAVVVAPLVTEMRENNRLEAVQRNVVGDGQLKDARIAVTAAQCRAVTDRDAAGMRDYLCRLTLDDGHTASLTLTADEDGQWHSTTGD